MHKLQSVQENEIHKILRDFEIQIDHPTPVRRPDLVLTKKKWKKIDKYMDLARKFKKLWKVKVMVPLE